MTAFRPVTMSAHDDEVGAGILGRRQDGVGGIAFRRQRLDAQLTRPRISLLQLAERLPHRALQSTGGSGKAASNSPSTYMGWITCRITTLAP